MKTIHIFYNGHEASFPENNDWEKFTGQDAVRTFLITAESWKRNGWDVKRLATLIPKSDGTSYSTGFDRQEFTGRIAREGSWFPAAYWQLVAKCCTLPADDDGEIWIGSYDVVNFGFKPNAVPAITWNDTLDTFGAISLQREHFSLSLFCATPHWFTVARKILADYDAERLPRIPGKYTSDETILRKYAQHAGFPWQAFPLADYAACSLVHFARSTMREAFGKIVTI